MATPRTVNAPRRKKARRKAGKRAKRAKRRVHATAVAAPKRKRRRKVKAAAAVAAPRRRRRKTRVAEASKRRSPRRRKSRKAGRRRRVSREAWFGNPVGHRKAAKKGWKRRKSGRRKVREASAVAAPRRRRNKRRRSGMVMEASRRKSRRGRRGSRRVRSGVFEASNGSMGLAGYAIAMGSAGFGFVLADGLDRFLATYDPTAAEKPTDKFTSDGAGTLGNTLNVSSRPGLIRAGVAVAMPALPMVGAMFVKNKTARIALSGLAVGAGVNSFKLLWNNVVMPLLRPKDAAELPKSFIARLYPAEVAAEISLKAARENKTAPVSSGALSGPSDVGPFALGGDSSYPDAAQALRRETGIHGPAYPSVQNTYGTGDEPYPTAQQAIYKQAGTVGGIFDGITSAVRQAGFSPQHAVRAASHVMSAPHDVHGALVRSGLPIAHATAIAPHVKGHVQRLNGIYIPTGVSDQGEPGPGVSAGEWQPGPPPGTGPGPKNEQNKDCGCVGDPTGRFASFLGDAGSSEETSR